MLGSIFKATGLTEALRINKPSSTVVVLNFDGWTEANIKGPLVHVVDKDYATYETSGFINSKTGNGSWEKNEVVDSEIAQKVIWNLPNANKVEIREAAGAVLVPEKTAKVSVESTSSGWIVTGGTFRNNNSEWHYIYRGRQKDLNGELTISAQKRFTRSYEKYKDPAAKEKDLIEDNTVSTNAGDFKFKLYKSDVNFTVNETNLLEIVETSATNTFSFSKLSFTKADKGKDFYYVVKEDPSKTKTGIVNSDGEVDIKIHVDVEDGFIKLKASSWKYLTSADKAKDDRSKATSVDNSTAYRVNYNLDLQGTDFYLGSVFNTVNKGSIKVTKTVEGVSATDKEYVFTVKNSNNKYITSTGKESDAEVVFKIKDKGNVVIDNLPFDTYTVTEKTNDENVKIDKYAFDTAKSKFTETVKIEKAGEEKNVTLKNVYSIDKGSISITKKVEKNDNSIATPEKYSFAVKNEEGNYVKDSNGTIGDKNVFYFPEVSAGEKMTIINLPVGKYYIEEKDARVAGTTLTTQGIDNAIEVAKNSTKSVTVTNKYELPKKFTGSLKIEKKMSNDSDPLPDGKKFPISVSVDKDSTLAVKINNDDTKLVSFKKDSPQIFYIGKDEKIVIEEILADTVCVVKENLSDEDKSLGYKTVNPSNFEKTIEKDKETSVTITNEYKKIKKGSIRITKTVTKDKAEINVPAKFQFALKNSDGKYITDSNGTIGNTNKVYSFEVEDGKNVIINNLAIGTYTVEEKDASIRDCTLVVSGLDGTVAVEDEKVKDVNVNNSYTSNATSGNIQIVKTIAGPNGITDKAKTVVEFTITGKNTKYTKTIKLNEFTLSSGNYIYNLNGLKKRIHTPLRKRYMTLMVITVKLSML